MEKIYCLECDEELANVDITEGAIRIKCSCCGTENGFLKTKGDPFVDRYMNLEKKSGEINHALCRI